MKLLLAVKRMILRLGCVPFSLLVSNFSYRYFRFREILPRRTDYSDLPPKRPFLRSRPSLLRQISCLMLTLST